MMNEAYGSDRITSYDVARALAVFGMVLVNYTSIFTGSRPGQHLLSSVVDLLYGRAAVLFVMLSGIGAVLLEGRTSSPSSLHGRRRVRGQLGKRSLVLLVMGYAFLPWWKPDILHFYSIYLAAGAVVLSLPAAWIGFLGLSILIGGGWLYWAMDGIPTLEYWMNGSGWWFALLDDWLLMGFYPVFPWLGFFLLGMALERTKMLRCPFWRRKWLVVALGAFAAAECAAKMPDLLAVAKPLAKLADATALALSLEAFPASPLWALSAAATAVLTIGLVMEAEGIRSAERWRLLLVATGRMTLTIYLLHILLGIGLLQLLENASMAELPQSVAAGLSLGFCLVAAAAAKRWFRCHRHGPAEWLLRRLTASSRAPSAPIPFARLISNRALCARYQPQRLEHLGAIVFSAFGRKSKPPALRVVVDSTACAAAPLSGKDAGRVRLLQCGISLTHQVPPMQPTADGQTANASPLGTDLRLMGSAARGVEERLNPTGSSR